MVSTYQHLKDDRTSEEDIALTLRPSEEQDKEESREETPVNAMFAQFVSISRVFRNERSIFSLAP
jgi:hypothetical protein